MSQRASRLVRRHAAALQPHPSWHSRRRCFQMQATPSTTTPSLTGIASSNTSASSLSTPSARFEVLGACPSSLLHISLSASQPLHTRRGSLVALHGSSNPSDAISSLSPLAPWLRLPLGVPFLYQTVTSASPISLVVGTKSATTTFAVLNLDGREDWVVTARSGLVAWSGERLAVSPRPTTAFGVAHLGQQVVTGRGLVALAGTGGVYSVVLGQGEQYICAPGNVLAYSSGTSSAKNAPEPYRLRSSSLRLAVPNLTAWLPQTRFISAMRDTDTYRFLTRLAFRIRTWTRRSLWGDRLFVRFTGPGTVLVQSRPGRLADVLQERDVVEILDSPAGELERREQQKLKSASEGDGTTVQRAAPRMTEASVGRDGRVKIG